MKCPVCSATYRRPESIELPPCHRCGADLTPLIQIHNQAIAHHRQAIAEFTSGEYFRSIEQNEKAIVLNSQESTFHAFAGQLWAVQGQFELAMRSWQIAQKLDPQNPTVSACLELLNSP